ncbi:MAG: antibiotic biosynthesis monooxygenase [Desulfobacterales bacterium]|uniref:Antibiotic biosynthesis monooxygenase n=1 Tax=Candidatus Desulfatibia vada TaxID=2841696 RepID=A0A8J6TQ90_9BACT|nr:antibiotic biosynthesis monooxygenase [Candidatus Desulfatibia vada]MBL6972236.1 antibiotic biosynthesis monooxygenase [Desulfobacterales bacterium]
MVGLELRILLEKEKRKEFLQAFDLLSKPQDKNDACVQKTLYENVGEDGRFIWVERWKDLKALKNYLISDHYRSLLGVIEVLGELEDMQLVEFKASFDH